MNLNTCSKLLIQNGEGNSITTTITSTVIILTSVATHTMQRLPLFLLLSLPWIMIITDIGTKMSMPRIYFLQVQESFFLNIQRQDHYVWNFLCCLMISLQEKTCSPVNCIIICTCIIYMCVQVLNIGNNYTYALNIHVYIQVCMCLCTQIVYTYI